MKRTTSLIFVLSVALCGIPAFAQGRGNSRGAGAPVNRGPSAGAGPSSNRGPEGRGPEINRAPDQNREHGKDADHDRSAGKGAKKQPGDFASRIENNPELNSKLTPLLPAGTDLKTAASGFKNQGQFIAALHVSKNLNIPFADLKARMTGSDPHPLGQAIHELKPDLSESAARKEAEKAEKQAKDTEKAKRDS